MELIGIHGYKRSGKDTIGTILKENLYYETYALADPIKDTLLYVLVNMYNKQLTVDDINGRTDFDREAPIFVNTPSIRQQMINFFIDCCQDLINNKKLISRKGLFDIVHSAVLSKPQHHHWSIRTMMQTLGTDIMVRYDDMYWMRFMMDRYLDCLQTGCPGLVITDVRQQHEYNVLKTINAKMLFVYRQDQIKNDSHITEAGLNPDQDDFIIINEERPDWFDSMKTQVFDIVRK